MFELIGIIVVLGFILGLVWLAVKLLIAFYVGALIYLGIKSATESVVDKFK